MDDKKKKRPHRIPAWIAIAVLSVNQISNSYSDFKLQQKVRYQNQTIRLLVEFDEGCNQIHQKIVRILLDLISDPKSAEDNPESSHFAYSVSSQS